MKYCRELMAIKLEQIACTYPTPSGICGKPSVLWNVAGSRCAMHQHDYPLPDPREAARDAKIIIVLSPIIGGPHNEDPRLD